jgi:hypothetical protein
MLWRQGDVFIETTDSIPPRAERQPHVVLADGELTGHRHRVASPQSATLYRHAGEMFLDVLTDEAAIVHEEHGTIRLPRGAYRVWRQREYVPARRRDAVTAPSGSIFVRD